MTESKEGIPETPGDNAQHTRRLDEVWGVLKVLFISLIIVLPIRYFIAQPFVVRGASMEPNFLDREYLVIDEVSYAFRAPRRGESIVFRYPKDPRQFFIKRIIGLPGETVEIQGGRVSIITTSDPGGFLLDEADYLPFEEFSTYPESVTNLQEGEYFVLGDNRNFSSDSRIWGPLNKKFIVGRTIFRAWPLARFGAIHDASLER